MSVWTWEVGTRRFRSWIPAEVEAYHFLVMWTPMSPREQEVFELFEGLDGTVGNVPQSPAEIAALLGMKESLVNTLVAKVRRKVLEYYRTNGLPEAFKPKKEPPR